VSTTDIDRDAAHDAAQSELAKPLYPKASWSEQLIDWLSELVYRLGRAGASLPGGWLTVAVLLVILAITLVVVLRIARRTMRTNRGDGYSLFDEQTLSASQHRLTAEQHAASGDWAAAIRHRLRAVARQLEESAILDPVPGRTATELARDAGRQLTTLAAELDTAAHTFNDVTYGGQPGTRSGYQLIVDLDDHLRIRTPAAVAAVDTESATNAWAEVR
jgi:hypothetical protein